MKKLIIYLCVFISIFAFSCKKNEETTSNALTTQNRCIIIVNETKSAVFKSCKLFTSTGVEVEGVGFEEPKRLRKDGQDENCVLKNIDEKVGFEEFDKFKIVLVDSMNIKFEKEFEVNSQGETIITITEEDIVDANIYKKFSRAINNL